MRLATLIVLVGLTVGCGRGGTDDHAHEPAENWAVTAWGTAYEIFAECGPLIAGDVAKSHTHVTILEDFSPLRTGVVTAFLTADDGQTHQFRQPTPVRNGIYSIEIRPASEGEFALSFRVESTAGTEDIAAGRVRVGNPHTPGVLLEPPAGGIPLAAAEPISFLKEQQWQTEFRTALAREGSLRASVRGPGKLRAAAGAEAVLAAPLDGVVVGSEGLYVGRPTARGTELVRLAPRASSDRTLGELEAQMELARARLRRLEELLTLEAVSVAEVEEARARVRALAIELEGSHGTSGETRMSVRAPFSGEIAEVHVVTGQAVSAGDPLLRLVRREPLWIEVALLPRMAAIAAQPPAGLVLRASGFAPVSVDSGRTRFISQSPEVDPVTGTVATIVEVRGELPLSLGTTADIEILLRDELRGVVVPASAVVDDGGSPVIYVQIEGESFARQEVNIGLEQGENVLVIGLPVGVRLVERGGNAIRRAALMSTGAVEGHVH